MAFRINQAAIGGEEAICRLKQEEMLPDIACIACVHSVIVMAHPDYGSLILVHLLGDIEGLRRCSYGDLLGIVEACLGGGGCCGRGSEQLLVYLVGQPAGTANADEESAGNGGNGDCDIIRSYSGGSSKQDRIAEGSVKAPGDESGNSSQKNVAGKSGADDGDLARGLLTGLDEAVIAHHMIIPIGINIGIYVLPYILLDSGKLHPSPRMVKRPGPSLFLTNFIKDDLQL